MKKIIISSLVLSLSACASNPDKLGSSYVSPIKYADYTCQQVAAEQENVSGRTIELYNRLKKERNADNWQMGIGLLVLWPTLFFLEGGDGVEASEYSRLKGEYEALRQTNVQKSCDINFMASTDELIKMEDQKADQLKEAAKVATEASEDATKASGRADRDASRAERKAKDASEDAEEAVKKADAAATESSEKGTKRATSRAENAAEDAAEAQQEASELQQKAGEVRSLADEAAAAAAAAAQAAAEAEGKLSI